MKSAWISGTLISKGNEYFYPEQVPDTEEIMTKIKYSRFFSFVKSEVTVANFIKRCNS